jgi:hypothetical protein
MRPATSTYLPGKAVKETVSRDERIHGPSGLARKVVRIREFGKEGLAVGAAVVGEL